ncbi:hypothetical protein [Luteimonas salinilitoris]|uniref:Baseplate protein J-like domain-containing protein n=1 Tax=Luteimonas salinilitoris TaxID=3237697 RepID=A0ABV4HPD5_9GAMM
MPIELPDLDDIDYDDLVAGAIAALPGYGSDWTDYNASDPGITVLEMLAWLTEMLVYRTDRIQPRTYLAFMQLLMGYGESALSDGGAEQTAGDVQAALHGRFEAEPEQTVRDVLLTLRRRYRAVTVDDYEQLALITFPETLAVERNASVEPIDRLTCLSGKDATDTSSGTPADLPGAVSLVVLPRASTAGDSWVEPSSDLVDALLDFFEDRRLITTTVCVAGPRFVSLRKVKATLYIDGDARPPGVLLDARRALFEYLHPARGGNDHGGWPFGRAVRSADLMARLANVAGVSFVEDVTVKTSPSGDGDSVALEDDQLPQLAMGDIDLSAKVLKGSLGQQDSDWVDWNPEENG